MTGWTLHDTPPTTPQDTHRTLTYSLQRRPQATKLKTKVNIRHFVGAQESSDLPKKQYKECLVAAMTYYQRSSITAACNHQRHHRPCLVSLDLERSNNIMPLATHSSMNAGPISYRAHPP